MGRITLPGIIMIIVLFLFLAGLISSQIQVDNTTITLPSGMPTSSVSLLHLIWSGFVSWLKEAF